MPTYNVREDQASRSINVSDAFNMKLTKTIIITNHYIRQLSIYIVGLAVALFTFALFVDPTILIVSGSLIYVNGETNLDINL